MGPKPRDSHRPVRVWGRASVREGASARVSAQMVSDVVNVEPVCEHLGMDGKSEEGGMLPGGAVPECQRRSGEQPVITEGLALGLERFPQS